MDSPSSCEMPLYRFSFTTAVSCGLVLVLKQTTVNINESNKVDVLRSIQQENRTSS